MSKRASKAQGALDLGETVDRQMSLAEDPDIWLGDLLTAQYVELGRVRPTDD